MAAKSTGGFLGFFTAFFPKSTQEIGANYPLHLDGSLKYTRFKTGYDFWPAHDNADNFAKLGCVDGFMPLQDALVWSQGYGQPAFGPIASELPLNLNWQITIPGLNKQSSP